MKLLYHIIEKHNFSSMPWLSTLQSLNSVSKLGIFHVIAAVGEKIVFGCTKKTSHYSHNFSLLSFSFKGNCFDICLCGGVHNYLLNVDGWDVFVSFQTRKLHPTEVLIYHHDHLPVEVKTETSPPGKIIRAPKGWTDQMHIPSSHGNFPYFVLVTTIKMVDFSWLCWFAGVCPLGN